MADFSCLHNVQSGSGALSASHSRPTKGSFPRKMDDA